MERETGDPWNKLVDTAVFVAMFVFVQGLKWRNDGVVPKIVAV